MTFPLFPALVLSLLSILSSGFVVLRIILPILASQPFGRKIPRLKCGPVNRCLTVSDKCHLWLAFLDVAALCIFLWQAVVETQSSSHNVPTDSSAAARLWVALTVRQTCLCIIAASAVLYTRMGRPVAFGWADYLLWAPTAILISTSTVIAGVLAHLHVMSLMLGLVAYSAVLAIGSTLAFGFLVASWAAVRHNFNAHAPSSGSWPPPSKIQQRTSFATEDVDALKDGSSWFTSIDGSRGDTMSSFSFSTTETSTSRPPSGARVGEGLDSNSTLLNKPPYWIPHTTPRTVSEAGGAGITVAPTVSRSNSLPGPRNDPNPVKRDALSRASADLLRLSLEARHLASQRSAHVVSCRTSSSSDAGKSWITSPTESQVTLTEWSFPDTIPATSTPSLQPSTRGAFVARSPVAPASPAALDLTKPAIRGYGSSKERSLSELEQGCKSVSQRAPSDTGLIGWFVSIWVPFGLSLPYLLMYSPQHGFASQVSPITLVLSVTISAPLLALHLVFGAPLPTISSDLVTNDNIPTALVRSDTPKGNYRSIPNLPANMRAHIPKSLTATATVADRQSGVWLGKGGFFEGRGKLRRVLGLLHPRPRLAVFSSTHEQSYDGDIAIGPPTPKNSNSIPIPTVEIICEEETDSQLSATGARSRKESKASSHRSGYTDADSNAHIEIARRHYSTLAHAQTITITPTPTRSSFIELHPDQHIRARTISSVSTQSSLHTRSRSAPLLHNSAPTPPPSDPLPPTPDSIKRSHSRARSSGYMFPSISSVRDLESIMSGLFSLLVPNPKSARISVQTSEDWETLILNNASLNEHGGNYISPLRVSQHAFDKPFETIPEQLLLCHKGEVPAQSSLRVAPSLSSPELAVNSTPVKRRRSGLQDQVLLTSIPEPVEISSHSEDLITDLDEISRALEEFSTNDYEDGPLQPHTNEPAYQLAHVSPLSIARDINEPVSPLGWKTSRLNVDHLSICRGSYRGRASTETVSSLPVQTPATSSISLQTLLGHNAMTNAFPSQSVMHDEGSTALSPAEQDGAQDKRMYRLPVPPARRVDVLQDKKILAESNGRPILTVLDKNNGVPFRPLRLKGKNLASEKRFSVSSETNQGSAQLAGRASVDSGRRSSIASSKRPSMPPVKLDQNGMRPLSLVKGLVARVPTNAARR